MSSVTIKEVAKKANVSIATVSRVLNYSDKVTPQTREKVLAACDDLGYSPNVQAKRLKLGKTNSIMAVLPFLTLPSIVERLRGVQQALAPTEFDLIPFSVGTPEDREAYLLSLANRSRADGVLIISMPITEQQVQRFLAIDMPVVLIDSVHPQLKRINVNDRAGGKLAASHLIELGHRNIGFISDHLDNPLHFLSMAERFKGYLDALHENGIDFNPEYQRQGEHGREEANRMALELLQMPQPPTAIVAASDTQAIGVLDAARQLGLKVPHQLSVIGYDDIRDAGYVHLTTIKQPLFESGLAGGNAIVEQVEHGISQPLEINLPISLILRETTAPPGEK